MGEGQKDLHASAAFLNSFSLKYLIFKVPCFGVVCSEPHQWLPPLFQMKT